MDSSGQKFMNNNNASTQDFTVSAQSSSSSNPKIIPNPSEGIFQYTIDSIIGALDMANISSYLNAILVVAGVLIPPLRNDDVSIWTFLLYTFAFSLILRAIRQLFVPMSDVHRVDETEEGRDNDNDSNYRNSNESSSKNNNVDSNLIDTNQQMSYKMSESAPIYAAYPMPPPEYGFGKSAFEQEYIGKNINNPAMKNNKKYMPVARSMPNRDMSKYNTNQIEYYYSKQPSKMGNRAYFEPVPVSSYLPHGYIDLTDQFKSRIEAPQPAYTPSGSFPYAWAPTAPFLHPEVITTKSDVSGGLYGMGIYQDSYDMVPNQPRQSINQFWIDNML